MDQLTEQLGVQPKQPSVMAQYLVDLDANQDAAQKIGEFVTGKFNESKMSRNQLELDWVEAEQVLRRKYAPAMNKMLVDEQKSEIYSGLSRRKVTSFEARMLELLFPRTDRNWTLEPKPVPELSDDDLRQLLAELVETQRQAIQQQIEQTSEQTGQEPPNMTDDMLTQMATAQITSDMIDAAIKDKAKASAAQMTERFDNYLTTLGGGSDTPYEVLAGLVFCHASRYRVGLLQGPMTEEYVKPTYSIQNGQIIVDENVAYRPYAEVASPFDWYPDWSARSWKDKTYDIFRHMLSYNNYAQWAKKPGWSKARGIEWLRANKDGKHTDLDFDTKMRFLDISNGGTNVKDKGKFEVRVMWVYVTQAQLKDWGLTAPDEFSDRETMLMGFWVVDGMAAKALFWPIPDYRMVHAFVFDTKSSSMIGDSFITLCRTAQQGSNASIRAVSDNAAYTGGPLFEVDDAMLANGTTLTIQPFSVIHKDTERVSRPGDAVVVREIPDKTSEIMAVAKFFEDMADKDTFIGAQTGGDFSVGASEAMRTKLGVVALMSNTALPFKDAINNFDQFTASFFDSLIKWEKLFGDPMPYNDVVPVPRGARSLLGREVASAELLGWAQNLPAWLIPTIKPVAVAQSLAETQNFPAVQFVKTQDEFDSDQAAQQQYQQALQQAQLDQLKEDTARTKADSFKAYAQGVKNMAGANSTALKAMLDAIDKGVSEDEIAHAIALAGSTVSPSGTGGDAAGGGQGAPAVPGIPA